MDNLIEIGQQAAVAVMVVVGLILSIVFGVQSENPDALMSSDTGNTSTIGGDVGSWKPDIPDGRTDDTGTQDSNETAPNPTEMVAPNLGNPSELNQGDRITVTGRGGYVMDCTVGYVDADNNRAYTAAHCMGDVLGNGTREFTGGDVYKCYSDASCAFSGALAGTIHYAGRYLGSAPYDDSHTFTTPTGKNEGVADRDISTDIAVIELSGNTQPGRNAISGGGGAAINPKDQLCYYGATTGNSTGKSICGYEFVSPFKRAHAVFVTENRGVQRGARAGDSGGAVFSPNGGVVGIVSKEQGKQGNTFYAPFNPR